jgi:amidophosphoribosyltransferase
MEGTNIYVARKNIGKFLAKKFPIKDADLVIPVHDYVRPENLACLLMKAF